VSATRNAAPTAPRKRLRPGRIVTGSVRLLGLALLSALALSMMIPFLWMMATSLKTNAEAFTVPPTFLPTQFRWENYQFLFTRAPFGRYLINSLIVTGTTVFGQLLVCSMAAYAFARLSWMGRDSIFIAYLATMMIPFQVTLIPTYLIVRSFGWLDTYWGLIVPGLGSAYGVFLLRQSFLAVPRDLQDAARIDGASEWQIYWRIFMPLVSPTLATLGVFTFMGTWTDLLWPLLVVSGGNRDLRTLELGLAYFQAGFPGWFQTNWPQVMAGALVVLAPVVLVYILAQRYFVRGITLTGIKG
jgi:multiple sugar transport system permease protein